MENPIWVDDFGVPPLQDIAGNFQICLNRRKSQSPLWTAPLYRWTGKPSRWSWNWNLEDSAGCLGLTCPLKNHENSIHQLNHEQLITTADLGKVFTTRNSDDLGVWESGSNWGPTDWLLWNQNLILFHYAVHVGLSENWVLECLIAHHSRGKLVIWVYCTAHVQTHQVRITIHNSWQSNSSPDCFQVVLHFRCILLL